MTKAYTSRTQTITGQYNFTNAIIANGGITNTDDEDMIISAFGSNDISFGQNLKMNGCDICCVDSVCGTCGDIDVNTLYGVIITSCDTLLLVANCTCVNNNYFLPHVDGTIGQVMCTDGSGTLGWGTGGGGSSFWVDGTAPYIVACNSCGVCVPAGNFASKLVLPVGTNCY